MFNFFKKKIQVPPSAWLQCIEQQMVHTPDIARLEQYQTQLLFVPDDYKRGHKHYSEIDSSVFVCHGFTKDPFSMWSKQGEHPVCMLEQQLRDANAPMPPWSRVKGEIHALLPEQFVSLDVHRENGVIYKRRRVSILVPTVEIRTYDLGEKYPLALRGKKNIRMPETVTIVKTWMYIGVPAYWNNLLDAGFSGYTAVPTYHKDKPWMKQYYDYPKIGYEGS